MSFYNMIFGRNPHSGLLLALVGLDEVSVGRFRDAFVAEGKICVYTRNGGGNRECWYSYDRARPSHSPEEDAECTCCGCFMTYRVHKLPHYSHDRDDVFDSTYATIYFDFPEEFREVLEALDSGKPFDPEAAWMEAIEKVKEGDPVLMEKFKPVIEQISKALEAKEE